MQLRNDEVNAKLMLMIGAQCCLRVLDSLKEGWVIICDWEIGEA